MGYDIVRPASAVSVGAGVDSGSFALLVQAISVSSMEAAKTIEKSVLLFIVILLL